MSTNLEAKIIIRINPDEYENNSWPIYIVPDGIDPNDVVKQLLAEEKILRDWVQRTRDFRDQWEEANPSPPWDSSQMRPIKKWPAGMCQQDITPEMRAEREETKAFNKALADAHGVLSDAWHERQRDAMRQWIADQDNYPEQLVDNALFGWHLWRPEYEFQVSTIPIWGTTNATTGPTDESGNQ